MRIEPPVSAVLRGNRRLALASHATRLRNSQQPDSGPPAANRAGWHPVARGTSISDPAHVSQSVTWPDISKSFPYACFPEGERGAGPQQRVWKASRWIPGFAIAGTVLAIVLPDHHIPRADPAMHA